jgi:hypothetical protein
LQVVVTHQEREVEIVMSRLFPKDFKLVSTQGHEPFQHVSQKNLDLRALFN